MLGSSRFRNTSLPSRNRRRVTLVLEELEARRLLSADLTNLVAIPAIQATPAQNPAPGGYSPAQISQAYGFNQIAFSGGAVRGDGTGQTIAIVDAYNDPNIASDVNVFDQAFPAPNNPAQSLYQQYGDSSSFLKVVNQTGGSTLPTANASWATEISLDVEWAHAMAPGAKILLVEASAANVNLLYAVGYASNYTTGLTTPSGAAIPAVSVVSMSWGFNEFSTESSYDSYFTTPTGHQGVTFVAASGDSGAPPIYPASSPDVLAVGGTTLSLDASNNISSETGWGYGRYSFLYGGSGGGYSKYEPQPSYQAGLQYGVNSTAAPNGKRMNPDVAYDANPSTGYDIYDSTPYSGYVGWYAVGGTSAGSPQWSALVAIADQGRALNGGSSLNGVQQTLPTLYQLPQSAFHDITSGNNYYPAGPGYDLVTGRGTPVAPQVVQGLVGAASAAVVLAKPAATTTTGTSTAQHKDVIQVTVTTPAAGTTTGTPASPIVPTPSTITVFVPSAAGANNNASSAFLALVTPGTGFFGSAPTPVTPPFTFAATTTAPSFGTFTGLPPVSRLADSGHTTGGTDGSLVVDDGGEVPVPAAVPVLDREDGEGVPAPAMEDRDDSARVPGCDACFASEDALLALRDETLAPAEAAEGGGTMSAYALFGLAAALAGCWTDRQAACFGEEWRRPTLLPCS